MECLIRNACDIQMQLGALAIGSTAIVIFSLGVYGLLYLFFFWKQTLVVAERTEIMWNDRELNRLCKKRGV